jgi:5,10-methylenetetrahydromethanopterin reductase
MTGSADRGATRPKLKFAAVNFRGTPAEYVKWVRVAEDVGFDLIGTGDSQSLWPELNVLLTLTALNTSRAAIGPVVSNPLTRHPAVAASAITAIQHLAEGRAFFGMSSGDSAVFNLGLRPARVDGVADYGTTVKTLCAGEAATYQGHELQLHWPARPVPLYLAAEGPRMLRLAGRIADGVFVANGLTPEVVHDTIRLVAEGATEAGRDPAVIEIWWLVKFLPAPSVAEGIEMSQFTLASSANHVFRFDFEGKHVPEQFHEPIRKLQEEYVFSEHARVQSSGRNAQLVHQLGLTEFLAERFAITGPMGHCIERIEEVASYGAVNLLLTQLVPDPIAEMRKWDKELFPRIR